MLRPHGARATASAAARIGYLWIPHLPLAVALRRRPAAADRLVVIGGSPHDDGVVIDASEGCLAVGVRIGQPLREAWECCPEARFLPANPEADQHVHQAALDLVASIAPAVEDDGLGRAVFSLDQPVDPLAGGRLLAWLRTLLRARLRLRARLALAPGRFAARVAAERDPAAAGGQPPVIAGDVAAYLAPLPIEALPLPPQARDRLRRLGVTTIGQFAALPRAALGRRFGAAAVAAHRLALGEDNQPVVPRPRPLTWTARHVFEPPVATREPLLATAERLLAGLCARLGAEDRSFRQLVVRIETSDGATAERTAHLRAPTASLAACRTTLRVLVDALTMSGPVAAVTVVMGAFGPSSGEQLPLAAGAADAARRRQRLAAAVREAARRYPARLRRVAPRELPTLLKEEQFLLLPYEPADARTAPPKPGHTARPIRLARRNGRCYLVEAGHWDELVAIHGCWRAEEWWPAVVSRVYWRVRTRAGRVVTLARDGAGWRLVEVLD